MNSSTGGASIVSLGQSGAVSFVQSGRQLLGELRVPAAKGQLKVGWCVTAE